MLFTGSCSPMRSGRVRQVREDTRGRLQAPARSTQTPISTLRRSHFPDPPTITLPARKACGQTVLRLVPDAPKRRRPAAVVKRSLLDEGEDRRIIDRRERRLVDIEGSQMSASSLGRTRPTTGRQVSGVARSRASADGARPV